MTSASLDTQEWYLEVESRRIGPFLGQQIADLFKDGEILSRHKVISLDGANVMSVEQFIQQLTPTNAPETQKPELRPGDDPEVRLFDALQAARERKYTPPTESAASRLGYGSAERDPRQTWWMGAVLGVICLLAVWGLISVFRTGAGTNSSGAHENVSSVRTTPQDPAPASAEAPSAQHRPADSPPPLRQAPSTGGGASYSTQPPPAGAAHLERNHRGSAEGSDHSRGNDSHDDSRDTRGENRDEHENEGQAPVPEGASPQDPSVPDNGLPTPTTGAETVFD